VKKTAKYRISQNISILNPEEFMDEQTPQQYQHGHFVLLDQGRDKSFLINETVKYFIDKFSLPKTRTEVLQEIALDVKTDVPAIRKQCASFFSFLCRKKIVVPEDWTEPAVQDEPFYKVGEIIGSFMVLEILSSRKYVDIYLVGEENQLYVIKLLNPQKFSKKNKYEEELLVLKHEYDMLQKVKHIPFMCQAFSFQENAPPGAYIQLEYIKGDSLGQYLQQSQDLNETACYAIMGQMIQTFALLHENNLIHGDIHPANILVREDHSLKVIDLGLSMPQDVDQQEVIKFGGVHCYMPPERINLSSVHKFSKEPDLYSDVYQIGLILYYILYLKEPFTGYIWEELSENIKSNKIIFPEYSFRHFKVPEQLTVLIRKCTIKTRAKRYPSAAAVWNDFQTTMLNTQVATT
jgi:serine/threonine-protein kinase